MPGQDQSKKEVWIIADDGTYLVNIHPKSGCSGNCVVHSPSDHHMREYPLGFNSYERTFFRTCPHGEEHQDPDEREYWKIQLDKAGNSDRKSSLVKIAMQKLTAWDCPLHRCGCCTDL